MTACLLSSLEPSCVIDLPLMSVQPVEPSADSWSLKSVVLSTAPRRRTNMASWNLDMSMAALLWAAFWLLAGFTTATIAERSEGCWTGMEYLQEIGVRGQGSGVRMKGTEVRRGIDVQFA